jgi:putative membrane protein
VIDPLTLLGDQWFLGKIYIYPQEGPYFGVTLSNFAGWFFVGSTIPLAFQQLSKLPGLHSSTWRMPSSLQLKGIVGVYAGIFIFNLAITLWIQQWTLMFFSSWVAGITLLICYVGLQKRLSV